MDQLDSICPIFCDKKGERFSQIGSGVLIEFRGCCFLLTAAHVIDRLEDSYLMVPHKNNEISCIDGSYAFIKGAKNRDEDYLDYGYFKLDDKFATELKQHFYFIKEHELGVKKHYREKELFSFAGYPCRKSNVEGTRATTKFFSYGTYHADQSEYERFGCARDANIIAKFNRKNTFVQNAGRIEMPVLPHGISGGGVFIWPMGEPDIPPKNRKLVGLGHTWKAEGFFIGTRIEILLAAILKNNPVLIDKA